jgi:hypothetical protein
VYLSNGTEVAASDGTTGLWSGTLMHAIDTDLNTNQSGLFVWSGTSTTGQQLFVPLGSPTGFSQYGATGESDGRWIDVGVSVGTGIQDSLYGISQALIVPGLTSTTPEPSTAIVAAFGAVAFSAYGWSRHRRAQRRQAAA